MRRTIVAGNWKMNKNVGEAVELAKAVVQATQGATTETVVCPAYPCLVPVAEAIKGSDVVLGAQDVHWEPKGAYTGKVSCDMLKSAGVTYVIIGHSEQRTYFHETNESVNQKVKAALAAELKPIICVGETLEEREAGKTEAVVEDHVKGAWNIEAGDSFAAYAGWLLPFDAPIVLVVDSPEQEVDVRDELLRIGFDHVLGHLAGGMDAWQATGGETSSCSTATWEELRAPGTDRVLDVRQPYEWRTGVIPGSDLVFVADLPATLDDLDRDASYLVACRTGVRAAIAASLLDAAGIRARAVVDGGVPALSADELEPAEA